MMLSPCLPISPISPKEDTGLEPVSQLRLRVLNAYLLLVSVVPPLRAARSFSDFQSGPITGFGLRGQVFKVVPPPLGYQLLHFKFSGPGGNRTHHTNLAKVGRLLGSCEPIKLNNQIIINYHSIVHKTY